MNNKYFDTWEFKKALANLDFNPFESVVKLENYLSKYPKDYSMRAYYSYSLITVGEFNKARKILEQLEKEAFKDPQFVRQTDKVESLRKNIIFNKMRFLSYIEKYDDLYNFYLNNKKRIIDMDINEVAFYSCIKAGKLDPNVRENHRYLFRQILEYKESDFLDHIQKHLADYNAGLEEPNKNIFSSKFPLDKVLKEIEKHFDSMKALYTGFFEDTYIFKYDACGRADDRLVDCFKVVCFHNTKNIITMCPVSNANNLPSKDLNYMVEEKVKMVSQIDKFNKRFKR